MQSKSSLKKTIFVCSSLALKKAKTCKKMSLIRAISCEINFQTSRIRSDEGLMLETSASESLYGGQFTLSTQLIKPNYPAILSTTQHHSFFRNLPLLFQKLGWEGLVLFCFEEGENFFIPNLSLKVTVKRDLFINHQILQGE